MRIQQPRRQGQGCVSGLTLPNPPTGQGPHATRRWYQRCFQGAISGAHSSRGLSSALTFCPCRGYHTTSSSSLSPGHLHKCVVCFCQFCHVINMIMSRQSCHCHRLVKLWVMSHGLWPIPDGYDGGIWTAFDFDNLTWFRWRWHWHVTCDSRILWVSGIEYWYWHW